MYRLVGRKKKRKTNMQVYGSNPRLKLYKGFLGKFILASRSRLVVVWGLHARKAMEEMFGNGEIIP